MDLNKFAILALLGGAFYCAARANPNALPRIGKLALAALPRVA